MFCSRSPQHAMELPERIGPRSQRSPGTIPEVLRMWWNQNFSSVLRKQTQGLHSTNGRKSIFSKSRFKLGTLSQTNYFNV